MNMKKKIKIYTLIISLFMILFASVDGVKAAEYNTKTVSQFPSKLNDVNLTSGLFNIESGPNLFYKYSTKDNLATMCTSFMKNNPNSTYTCSKESDGWSADNAVSSGVAAIIIKASGGTTSKLTKTNYYYSELAINTYLKSAKPKKNEVNGRYANKYMVSYNNISSVKSLTGAAKIAQTAYDQFNKNNKLSVTLGAFNCDSSHNCTANVKLSSGISSKYNKDTSYQSKVGYNLKKVTINGTTLESNQYSYSDNKLTIKNSAYTIPSTTGTHNFKVKVTFEAKRDYYLAQNYSCGTNQTVTPNVVKKATQTKTGSSASSFTYNVDSETVFKPLNCGIVLYKVSAIDESPLSGAVLSYKVNSVDKTLSLNGFDEDEENTIPYIGCVETTVNPYNMTNIEEISAPTGYRAISSISDINYTGTIIEKDIKNNPDTNLIIRKIDGDSKKLLAGATLALYDGDNPIKWNYVDASGNVVTTPVDDGAGNYYAMEDDNGINTSWQTTDKGLHFIGLAYNTEYDIVEIKAPKGYIINNETTAVTLTNEDNGRNKTIEVKDYASSISLSKQDITKKQELPGAKLQIIDGQGNIYDEWISTNTPHIINTLVDGTYYLSETTAPKGYELNTETIEFTVENGKATSTVVMYNTPSKVTVADTLLGKNIITYVLGSMLIIAGAGVLFYEIKKKKHA